MKKRDILKLIFCSVMVFNLTANAVVKAEETDTTVNATETNTVVENSDSTQPEENTNSGENDANTVSLDNENSESKNYEGDITFLNELSLSTYTYDKTTVRNFKNGDDKIGTPRLQEGQYRSVIYNFVGWTDKPLVNGELASGARIFTKDDTLKTIFPEGLKGNEKLYAVYVGVNIPNGVEDPKVDLNLIEWIMRDAVNLVKPVNDGKKVTIDKVISSEDVLPETKIKEDIDSTEENRELRKIVDYYVKKDDVTDINEVVLNAEFEMNERIALLVYNNPRAGEHNKRVLTENYDKNEFKDIKVEDIAKNDAIKPEKPGNIDLRNLMDDDKLNLIKLKDVKVIDENGKEITEVKDKKEKGYTYVDLVTELDERIDVPKSFYLSLKSYSWRPVFITDGAGNKLKIRNAKTGEELENFNSLVDGSNPEVVFEVLNPNNSKTFRLRNILRDETERIENIEGSSEESIAEKIVGNMHYKTFSRAEIKKLLPNLSEEEINKRVIKISDSVAKELAKTNGEDTVFIKGYIEGVARSSVGIYKGILDTTNYTPITRTYSNILRLGYVDTNNPIDPILPINPTPIDPILPINPIDPTPVVPNPKPIEEPTTVPVVEEVEDEVKPEIKPVVTVSEKKKLPKTALGNTSVLMSIFGLLGMVFSKKRKNK